MGSIYRRAGSQFLWMKWRDHLGHEHRESAETANESEARAVLETIERQERARAPVADGLTVQRFFDEVWLPQRQRLRPFAWKTDSSRLEHHFLPTFGERALHELAGDKGEVELLEWLVGLRQHKVKRDGSPIAARTIWNVASIVRVFFADAVELKRISRDPTSVWNADRHLPAKRDKRPGWRARAGFTLEQVVTLTTDPRIPEDRRVLYAIRFLGGIRPGEASNARWRDLDEARCGRARWLMEPRTGWLVSIGAVSGQRAAA